MKNAILLKEIRDNILILTMNNPQKRNSLSEEMMVALKEELDKVRDDENIKVVIIDAMPPVFCAGHDLKALRDARADEDNGALYYEKIFSDCVELMLSIINLPQIVIASVENIATAAGCQLVATCDLAIASKSAKFATAGINIGLFCSTPMVALSRNIARKQAMKMLVTGEVIDAVKAYEIGLINDVVEEGQALNETLKLASNVASKVGVSLKIGKKTFYKQAELSLEEAYKYAAQAMKENMLQKDTYEGLCSFLDKKH